MPSQLEIWTKPTDEEILIKKQIEKGFYSEAFDILKATGAKTSAAIFLILTKKMVGMDSFQDGKKTVFCDITIHGHQFLVWADWCLILNQQEIHHWKKGSPPSGTQIKGAIMKYLDDNSAGYDYIFHQFNKLPF